MKLTLKQLKNVIKETIKESGPPSASSGYQAPPTSPQINDLIESLDEDIKSISFAIAQAAAAANGDVEDVDALIPEVYNDLATAIEEVAKQFI